MNFYNIAAKLRNSWWCNRGKITIMRAQKEKGGFKNEIWSGSVSDVYRVVVPDGVGENFWGYGGETFKRGKINVFFEVNILDIIWYL